MGDHDVTLSEQLEAALDSEACFCIACGQPDEDGLHDPARCPAQGGQIDAIPIADAVMVYDRSCEEEPDLEGDARALHCAIIAARDAVRPAQPMGAVAAVPDEGPRPICDETEGDCS